MMDVIQSRQNPVVQRLCRLKSAKGREAENLVLVEGETMIHEALGAGLRPGEALIEEGALGALGPLAERLVAAGASAHLAPRRILEAACDTVTPSGICCAFVPPEALDLGHAPKLIVALDGVQDPGNVGTIWRTADAAGFGALVVGEGSADPLSPKVMRGSMGSCFRLPRARVPSLAVALDDLKRRGYRIVATALGGSDIYQRPDLGDRIALVIGSEARGVSEAVLGLSDVKLTLPMRGGAESLNAAVAAGIVMYEITRGM